MRVKMSKPNPPAPTASAIGPCPTVIKIVGRPGTGSLPSTIAPPDHPGRKRRERTDESKNVQTTPTRTYCKCGRPLPYCNANCRTPRHWKFTQHHRATRLPQETVKQYKTNYLHKNSCSGTTCRARRLLYVTYRHVKNRFTHLLLAGPRSAIGRLPDS